jgi:2,3-dihydroxybenzoate decarboxylase
LLAVIEQMGVDRVMFAVDYPFELLEDGAAWLDTVALDEGDRAKIGRKTAERLLKI